MIITGLPCSTKVRLRMKWNCLEAARVGLPASGAVGNPHTGQAVDFWWVQACRLQAGPSRWQWQHCQDWQSFETVREGVRAGAHPDSPTRLCGAWAGHRAVWSMNMVGPWVPICAYSELLNPQVEPWVLADCWGTGMSGLLSILHTRQLLIIKLHLKSC